MDLSTTTTPKSDQQNYDDYIGGPKTVTVADVTAGSAEQPVDIALVEFPGRPFRPSKSMRRVLVAAWGSDSSAYAGRRMTLYGDPTVKFGGVAMGGIRISHLSHIDRTLTVTLTTTRGKRAPWVVEPLPTAEPPSDGRMTRKTRDQLTRMVRERGLGAVDVAAILGRESVSWGDLTEADALAVIAHLEQPTDQADEGEVQS